MRVVVGSSIVTLIATLLLAVEGFAPVQNGRAAPTVLYADQNEGGIFQGVKNFFAELDAFMDDASARRLGNGASFYGKRRSNFYGEQDKMKKDDPSQPNPLEDYQGPTTAGYFQWMRDENGDMRPVTRMKNKVIERNPKFWDRAFAEKEDN